MCVLNPVRVWHTKPDVKRHLFHVCVQCSLGTSANVHISTMVRKHVQNLVQVYAGIRLPA